MASYKTIKNKDTRELTYVKTKNQIKKDRSININKFKESTYNKHLDLSYEDMFLLIVVCKNDFVKFSKIKKKEILKRC